MGVGWGGLKTLVLHTFPCQNWVLEEGGLQSPGRDWPPNPAWPPPGPCSALERKKVPERERERAGGWGGSGPSSPPLLFPPHLSSWSGEGRGCSRRGEWWARVSEQVALAHRSSALPLLLLVFRFGEWDEHPRDGEGAAFGPTGGSCGCEAGRGPSPRRRRCRCLC